MNTATTPKPKGAALPGPTAEPAAASDMEKPAASRKRTKKRAAAPAPKAALKRTKTARIIALLERPSGASLKTIMKATGWQAHSVRGFLSGQLGKRMGRTVKSFEKDGERVYSLRNS